MPLYNIEKYLSRSLNSLITQTYKNIEIVCVNDGSTDNTLQILKDFAQKDSRIKIVNQKNQGIAAARNAGLKMATGKYIMNCDGDDWYEPTMCEEMLHAIENNKADVVICQCFFDYEKEDNKEIIAKKRLITEDYYNPQELPQKPHHVNVLFWNKIWKKEILDKYQILFPEGHEHDDDAFWLQYSFVANKIFYLKKKLYHYFIRSNSIMDNYFNKQPKNRNDRLAISEYVFNFLIKNNLLEKYEDAMIDIYNVQLNGCYKFFSPEENEQNCLQINEKIKKYFKSQNKSFHYKDNQIVQVIDTKKGNTNLSLDEVFSIISAKNSTIIFDDNFTLYLAILRELTNYHNTLRHYYLYRILSCFTFGKTAQHYKEKQKKLKKRIRQIKNFLKKE